MEERFVLGPEILGPIIRESYWKSVSKGGTDRDWQRIATLALAKLQEVVKHKTHHFCQNTLGDTEIHYMFNGGVITKIVNSEFWNAYDPKNKWICSGTQKQCEIAIQDYHKPKYTLKPPESET